MQYRPEIDGLRAIAVVPVILFHAGVRLLSGGFIGVDIFFVISGYLITTIILAELKVGTFSIVHFYERRARRILPALFVVMGLCMPFAWLWLMPSDLNEFAASIIAVLGFASNIFFWLQDDYFDAATEWKPLVHTWSLAVEEQFYVLFPIFLLLAWRSRRKWIVVILAVVSLLSLALAQYGASVKPVATFFLLPTRMWELAMGSLLAFYLEDKHRDELSPVLHQVLSLAGLGLIIYGLLTFNQDTPFPSWYALIPTVGAGLIIVFGVPGTFVGGLLGNRVLVGVGLVSYSAYLWHQPLLSLARHRSLPDLNALIIGCIVALTFGLAYLTWRYLERPFRDKRIVSKGFLWRSALISTVTLASLGIGMQLTTSDFQSEAKKEARRLFRADICMFGTEQTYKTLLENHCHQPQALPARENFEQSWASETFVLYGDSVAAHLYPGLARIGRRHQIIQLTGGACKAIRSVPTERCQDFYDWFVDEYVSTEDAKAILISSNWLRTYETLGDNEFRAKLNDLFARLRGKRVLVYSQAASLSANVRRYVYKREKFADERSAKFEVETEDLSAVNAALREEASRAGFEFVDISQLFCSTGKCTVAAHGTLYFVDKIHLSLAGSMLVAEATFGLLDRKARIEETSAIQEPQHAKW